MKFSDITAEKDLILYLNNANERMKNKKYIYHYTTINRCIEIFRSKLWYLAQARCMNDRLEYINGDKSKWENLFFASFMSDADESIGMWSMYAQPWTDGVKVAIPVKILKEWINGIKYIKEISCVDFKPTGRIIACNDNNKIFLSSVVYSNCDSKNIDEEYISCGTVKNHNFPNASHNSLLTGYVKDTAWDYEKEIRIKAEIDNTDNFSKVAIDIPDSVFNEIIITASPLFEGDLQSRLKKEINKQFSVDQSLFTDMFKIERICDGCQNRITRLGSNI